MKIIGSIIFAIILSVTQQCNDKQQKKSSPAGWSEPTATENTSNSSPSSEVTSHSEQNQQTQTQTEQHSTVQQQAQDPNIFRLSVSFYSIGSGIDQETRAKFEKFVAEYSPQVTVQSKRWGREGEIDYCFRLAELTKDQQEDFIRKAKNVIGSSKLVHFNENASCRN